MNLEMVSFSNFSSNVSLPLSNDLYKTIAGTLIPSAFANLASLVAPKRYSSLNDSATSVKVVFEVLSSASKYATATTLSAVLNSSNESDPRTDTAGRACLVM